ncbi:hypothetical protein Hdeb2414_s0022g00611781 [Helianthus debilis subsp. tardiflorus]
MSQQSQPIPDMSLGISEFLQLFSPISLHHSEPKSYKNPWVFWSESEGCENNSSSPHLATPPMIHEMIKSALSNTIRYWCCFAQFWAPVTIDSSRRLLSTSHQPFAVGDLLNSLAKYRLRSDKYKYNRIMLITHGQNYFHTPKRLAMAKAGRLGRQKLIRGFE